MDDRSNLEVMTSDELKDMEKLLAEERARREALEREQAQENMLASAYHRQIDQEYKNSLPIWVKPLLPMMGYPSGFSVWHNGEAWQNDRPEVNMTEPGTPESTWTSYEEAGTGIPIESEETD